MPPQPQKSNNGAVIAIVAAVVVFVVLVGVVAVVFLANRGGGDPAPVATGSASPSPSKSPSPSPSPSRLDPSVLDSEETDPIDFDRDVFFPDSSFRGDNDVKYTLAGSTKTDACDGIGSGKAKEIIKRHGCRDMLVAVWLDEDERIFSGIMVIPYETDDDADDVLDEIQDSRQAVIDSLYYYCPADGYPGADLCDRSSDNLPTWYASFTTFHRYLFVMVSLYVDGHRNEDVSEIDEFTSETVNYVSQVLLEELED